MAVDLRSSELEYNFIKERISNVEKYLFDITLKLSNYNMKLAELRDSGDDFSKSVMCFASKENLNQSLKTSLCEFSDLFSALQDYRDIQTQRIDTKIVKEFAQYNTICKKTKEELKRCSEARSTEFKKQTQLDKIRGKYPTNWIKISQAENELKLAQDEATYATQELSRRIDSFEKKKIDNIKLTLLKFMKIEMMFHAKALELHTNAYNAVKGIKVEEDLNEFSCHFKALSANLDAHCLSATNTMLKNTRLQEEPVIMHNESTSLLNTQELKNTLSKCKSGQTNFENLNCGFKMLSNSKFDFGVESL